MTKVINMETGVKYIYSLPPEKAVRVAYIQYVLGRWDTWNYSNNSNIPTPSIKRGRVTISCGDFVAFFKGGFSVWPEPF
jgi:hypothetical protein